MSETPQWEPAEVGRVHSPVMWDVWPGYPSKLSCGREPNNSIQIPRCDEVGQLRTGSAV